MKETKQPLMVENNSKSAIYVAIELSRGKWKLAFSDGKRSGARVVTIEAQDWEAFQREVGRALERFGLPKDSEVRSCYEIGREGFWVHRALREKGIVNIVVDPASIQVDRRRKRAKTDRMDAEQLVRQLIRHWAGEGRVWSVVRVPDEQAEDARQLHRDMETLKQERKQHRQRIQSLLFTQGIDISIGAKFANQVDRLKRWNGEPLAEQLKARLKREYVRLRSVEAELRELRRQQKREIQQSKSAAIDKVRRLQQLCGIGLESSWLFAMEMFAWREFRNRREVAGAIGLTPTPYQSGDSHREQGISHSGNRRIRAMSVEIAWCWLRRQPQSSLSQWFQKRFATGGARMRKIGIVAMARRLMVDLWRYLEKGTMPPGARLKAVRLEKDLWGKIQGGLGY
jgi:transposase